MSEFPDELPIWARDLEPRESEILELAVYLHYSGLRESQLYYRNSDREARGRAKAYWTSSEYVKQLLQKWMPSELHPQVGAHIERAAAMLLEGAP